MTTSYKRIWNIAAACVTASALVFSSCKEEEVHTVPVSAPSASLYTATVNSLTFTWEKIENATQYGYQLYDPAGNEVDGGVTSGTTATFTGLEDNTTYTLRIWAYAAYGSKSYDQSTVVEISGTTPKIVPLPAPEVTISTENGVEISWNAIDFAASYEYYYNLPDEDVVRGTTEYTGLRLTMLTPGTYEFGVKAISGNEAYNDSEYATSSFTVVKEKRWEAEGVFTPLDSKPDSTWTAVIEGWSDGSYVIRNWYNVEGYDLEFTVNSDETLNVTNASGGAVASGLSGDEYDIYIYTAYYNSEYYSNFSGTKDSGYLWFYNYNSEGYSEFTWPAPTEPATIDDLVGTWSQLTTGTDYTGYYSGDCTVTNDVTITKTGETTISLTGLFTTYDYPLTATFDEENQTLTFAPQSWLDYYTFSVYEDTTASVVASVSKNSITITNWSARAEYDGVWYDYVANMKTVLTK